MKVVIGIFTQGKYNRNEWVITYTLSYTTDLFVWRAVTTSDGNEMVGNENARTPALHAVA